MRQNLNADPTILVSLEQAGFDILYAFMLADGVADESEFDVIKKYLHSDWVHQSSLFNEEHPFYGECNFSKEFAYLKTLDAESLKRRFKKAVEAVENWLGNAPEIKGFKEKLARFALSLVEADHKITQEEQELINKLEKSWNIKLK